MFNTKPTTKNTRFVKPYYMQYDGKSGYAQIIGKIEKKFVAIKVNNNAGKINRIMKITKRKYFSDFGQTCTELHFKATPFTLS